MNNSKPTRLRRNSAIRAMVRETRLSMDQVIYPIFLVEGTAIKREISSLKRQYHYSVDKLIDDLPQLKRQRVTNLLLFASVDHKSIDARSGVDDAGVVQRAIQAIKAADPSFYVIADVCLCQYKADGHCCIYRDDGAIDRLETLAVLSDLALSYVQAGADMVAPSDMMDGRIAAIRRKLDAHGYEHTAIMAYSAKYASSFYGPFREAAHSAPAHGDRQSYQMDMANRREATREVLLDSDEGADIVMIKPAMPYLDIIADVAATTYLPVAAYQVSGEYAMLVNAVDNGILDKKAIYESLIAIRRSGAAIIITYFAPELNDMINQEAYGD